MWNQTDSVTSQRHHRTTLILLFAGCLAIAACGKNQTPPPTEQTAKPAEQTSSSATPAPTPENPQASKSLLPDATTAAESGQGGLMLPTGFGKRTGDLDEMVKTRTIRALLIVNPIGFFYQAGQPQGIQYEALQAFQQFVNQKLKTGTLPVNVVFLPMRPDQLEDALTEGLGDIIAMAIVITPERERRVAFSSPIMTDVSQVVVTGPALANVSSFDDMSSKDIYVNPLTTYYDNLKKVSADRQKEGKPPLNIKTADKNLYDDDLIEMVNAGLIPATVTIKPRADLWAQVLPNIKPQQDMVVATGQQMAWVMRKNNPQLKQLVDEFAQNHAAGTSFGNTLLRRYLQNTKWITNSNSPEELKKFDSYVQFFKQYGSEYNFDYLMLAAQGYQESKLNQNTTNRSGAVGVMQVIPKLAAANPIDIPNVSDANGNIHAGAKMMRNIADTYFNDPAIDPMDKTLFTFASYNAGPNRIVRLRKKAQADGLNPNKWFGNVELEVAKDVGQETVTYVDNIYKYYVAYKLAAQETRLQHNAVASK